MFPTRDRIFMAATPHDSISARMSMAATPHDSTRVRTFVAATSHDSILVRTFMAATPHDSIRHAVTAGIKRRINGTEAGVTKYGTRF